MAAFAAEVKSNASNTVASHVPPGISALYATDAALEAFDGEGAPFYEDLDWYARKAGDHQTPFTSALPLFRALAVGVEDIREEGMPARIDRPSAAPSRRWGCRCSPRSARPATTRTP